ncbi:putative MFS-type transporter SLC18B1 [Hypsibius exemplaris]|uniref:MFS-type transporter SLC18B1 n=1 Tax=Hypsibius exemplaris TaxID=2072580 RepID=A0A9X6RJA8_HYPEX|nr:putative MFS-type transporter SLC18B1 [Hypsibius exemplaris]
MEWPKSDEKARLITAKKPRTRTESVMLTSSKSRHPALLLATLLFVSFCSAVCYSLIAPFFPKLAVTKGGSQALASWVFGSYELVAFLVCPIFGRHISKIGPRFVFVSGIAVTGVACGLFGLLSIVQSYESFVALAFAIRIVEAVGAGAYLTASYYIAASEFPDHVATVQGFISTASGIGISTGPAVGGALFTAGGYYLPFVVMGVVLVLAAGLSYCVYRPVEIPDKKTFHGSYIDLLMTPSILCAGLSVMCGAVSIGFFEPSLELHIDHLVGSPFQVGLVFLASAGTFALSSPIWGWAGDHMQMPKILMTIGAVIVGVSYILMGPAPFLHWKLQLWMVIVALLIQGIGLGGLLVPPLKDAINAAIKKGYPNNLETRGLLSGLFASLFSLGAFLGPVVGGSLIDVISFDWTAVIIAGLNFFVAGLLMFYLVAQKRIESALTVIDFS